MVFCNFTMASSHNGRKDLVLLNFLGLRMSQSHAECYASGWCDEGESAQICAWPLRPLWTGNGMSMECSYDQKSIGTFNFFFFGTFS